MSSNDPTSCFACKSNDVISCYNCNCGSAHAYNPCSVCPFHRKLLCYIDTAVNKNRGNYLPLVFKQDVWISMVDDDDGEVLSNNVKDPMDRIAEIIPGLQFTITYKGMGAVSKDTMRPGCRGVRGTAKITILGKSDGSSVKSASKQ